MLTAWEKQILQFSTSTSGLFLPLILRTGIQRRIYIHEMAL